MIRILIEMTGVALIVVLLWRMKEAEFLNERYEAVLAEQSAEGEK